MTESDELPYIHFDAMKGVLQIEGKSIPENPDKTFQPLLEKIMEYAESPAEVTTVILKFEYINTTSVKWMFYILNKIQNMYINDRHKVDIKFYYSDENILETGKYFQKNLAMPIDLIKI